MKEHFIPRCELSDYEWDHEAGKWTRPAVDRKELLALGQRSNAVGFLRLVVHVALLVGTAVLTCVAAGHTILLAIPAFLFYAFLCGFLNGIEHELRHKIVFSRKLDGFSDGVYFLIHALFKGGSRYARVSHRLHHRYTMVRGIDPETDFPEVISPPWVRKTLWGLVVDILTLGVIAFPKAMWLQVRRAVGYKDEMMSRFASEKDQRFAQGEAAAILLLNVAVLALSIGFQRWELIWFLIVGPQVGHPIAAFWHLTEHIGLMHDCNDQRFVSRGVHVNPFVKFLYGGLDEHVEHHMYPSVPSRNLTKLRHVMGADIPERKSVVACWQEIMAIARNKDAHPDEEFVPIGLEQVKR